MSVVAVAGGAYLFFRGFRLLARKRLLLNTPTSKVRSAAMGLVEISGLAVGPYTIPAPITGKSCFLYRTTAWQRRDSGKDREWIKVAEETLHVPFYLDDNTGRLLVNPLGAELDLHRDFREEYAASFFGVREFAPAAVSEFLARNGVVPRSRVRIEECAIKPKNALFVLGTLSDNPGFTVKPSPLVREQSVPATIGTRGQAASAQPAPEVIRLSEDTGPATSAVMTQQARIAAALTKAGIQKPEAWAAAGVSPSLAPEPAPQVGRMVINGASQSDSGSVPSEFDLAPATVLMKGENNPAFMISWRSQGSVVRSLAWKSAAMIWGGAALVLLGVYMLLAQMALV